MTPPSDRKLFLLRAMLILGAGFWVFTPVLHGDWLMDDDLYITQNALLSDPARLWKIWFVPGSLIEYYPLDATVQAIQWQLWHDTTLGYHLTNILLHLFSALLVWRLLGKFGLRLAWLGGLLFAIHPVVVESVAWMSELKNTLSLPPFLVAMIVWIDYEQNKDNHDYLLALGLFLVAMLCKISMALFPFVILLYAWWKRDRVDWSDLKAAAPFAAISLVLGMTTIFVGTWFRDAHLQKEVVISIGGFLPHLALAGTSVAFYFFNCLWPVGLLPMYPKWTVDPPSLWQFLPWLIIGGMFYLCWTQRTGWGRHALLGLGFFFINLMPFAGFHGASYMAFSWVMDHFLYLPLIGLIGLIIAGLERVEERIFLRPSFIGVMALVMALLAWESHTYAGMFVDQETLWTYTIERNPSAWLAHNNLGNALFATGRVSEAIEQYEQALQINPGMAEAHNNLGVALNLNGQTAKAIAQYEQALRINPHDAKTHTNMGDALAQAGRIPEAMNHYEQALQTDPGNTEARNHLAKLQAQEHVK